MMINVSGAVIHDVEELVGIDAVLSTDMLVSISLLQHIY